MGFNPFQAIGGGLGAGFFKPQGGASSDVPTGARANLPPELLEYFRGIREQGIYGEGGAGRITNQALGAASRSGLAQGYRRRVSRRLGPRSGAASSVVANQLLAPQFGQMSQLLATLEAGNQRSRLQGAAGQFDVLRFLEGRFNTQRDFDERNQGPGFLDFLGPGLDIAGAFGFGVPGQGSAVT